MVEAVSYIRTSSAANIGADKDSEPRQRVAIAGFAKRAGFALVGEFTDQAVRGADPIETRPGFSALLDRIESNGVRVVIIEDGSRFARQLMTQELGLIALITRGVRVLTASGDDLTDDSDPSRTMMRQIAGAFHQYEKARLVAKLKGARDRKRASGVGRAQGRKTLAERDPEMVKLARQLHRPDPNKRPISLRKVSVALAEHGYRNSSGAMFSASSVARMLE
ncbi:recombinase family protein [Bradyrhizobium erythrophlei]|uniref:recombinase family protein n=1 Tax=Bradyrhizobium erythrophlei TaxID=1437360 RepID=UPI001FCCE8E8|nr:recombinase family protein [Bradyrhizobium erythrophlei]